MEDKCDSQILWDAGWYLIRFQYGLLERHEIPAWVVWVLPPEVVPKELAGDSGSAVAGCVQIGSYPSSVDFGGGNYLALGATVWFSADCTDGSVPNGSLSTYLVYAPGGTSDAIAICSANSRAAGLLSYSYMNNVYACDNP